MHPGGLKHYLSTWIYVLLMAPPPAWSLPTRNMTFQVLGDSLWPGISTPHPLPATCRLPCGLTWCRLTLLPNKAPQVQAWPSGGSGLSVSPSSVGSPGAVNLNTITARVTRTHYEPRGYDIFISVNSKKAFMEWDLHHLKCCIINIRDDASRHK